MRVDQPRSIRCAALDSNFFNPLQVRFAVLRAAFWTFNTIVLNQAALSHKVPIQNSCAAFWTTVDVAPGRILDHLCRSNRPIEPIDRWTHLVLYRREAI